jgi:soluble lytic murein transglycosylase-like protein
MCAHSHGGGTNWDFGNPSPMGGAANGHQTPGNHILSASAPPALQKYKAAIEYASKVTGVDANLIGAMIWAESRGNKFESSGNKDGNQDVGLMQISQHTFDQLGTGIKLNVGDTKHPWQNILAGALEFKSYLTQFHGNVSAALKRYISFSPAADAAYVINVLGFYNDLRNGKTPPDQDYAPT